MSNSIGARPLSSVTSAARMHLTLDVTREDALRELALLLPREPDGKGEVIARLRTASGAEPRVRLGRNFKLDSDLIERLMPIEGLANMALTAKADLRLVK